MILLKIAPVFFLVLLVGAEKKIELQDIEEDNLKSEKEANYDNESSEDSDDVGRFEYLKKGLLRYFKTPNPTAASPQRYVHQYAVTETQERSAVTPAPLYSQPGAQQAMVGYLSNVPMQIYLVPQQYSGSPGTTKNSQHGPQYSGQNVNQIAHYSTHEGEQPAHVSPSVKEHVPPYSPPVTYVSFSLQPTAPPAVAAANAASYQEPLVQYQSALVPPPTPASSSHHLITKAYYSHDLNPQGQGEDDPQNVVESQNYYHPQTDGPYIESQSQDVHHYYNQRTPLRVNSNSELPHPSPLLLKPPPSHLSHIPKALPIHRPWSKPVYNSGRLGIGSIAPKAIETYGPMFKRRPTSLLDSYVPSSLQIEYLKRGIIKDPLVAYEALSNGFNLDHLEPNPRYYETGFLPNQVFHTAGGGSFYGHYKRSPKDKRSGS
uniref:Uncharacterized protein n=1 Tax=Papilio xuthus TaxID=66420 RepID=I4DN71_PAPXU|nr:uncharacterized protein LOC106121628 precursor [Papilio xuthus]BAM19361.1 unknown secreted protein [Papilio xuthus]